MAGTYVVDYSTGLYATIGTLGALQARNQTGKGQMVDVALMDSALSMLMTAIPEQLVLGRTMTRRGNRDRYCAPANTFPTRDGAWVHLAIAGDPAFQALSVVMHRTDLPNDPRFRDNDSRMQNVDALEKIVSDWTCGLYADELLEVLKGLGIPSARVASIADLVGNAALTQGERIIDMPHPKAGRIPMQGFSVRFGDSPMRLRHAPPVLGEHTHSVLAEWLGLSPERIAQLGEQGAL
jgi:CoA:oxalate CoA-transferase